ncbi:hypothetical protein [Kitasatospora sp. NPDC087315]|uniref:hypothetical protein n=1 Tax=Kitasatospora sp. NPDC087315 TaxID=3364069 RepID=UPI0038159D01
MTDNETNSSPDLEAVREEARKDALAEMAPHLARAMIKAQAAQAGSEFPDAAFKFLDISKLLGEDGLPSSEIVGEAIAPFLKPAKPEYAQNLGLGRQGSSYTIPVLSNSRALDARYR